MKKLFGVTTAMLTPFTANDTVDYAAICELTHFLIEKGVHCLYPLGTTGEFIHLTLEERKKIAQTVVQVAAGRVPVFIQCGALTQSETTELLRHAEQIGADGAGIVTPIFLKVNNRELSEYYASMAGSVRGDFPIYTYSIPQCAANELEAATLTELAAKHPNIIGIKYSYSDVAKTVEYLNVNNGNFSVLHGADSLFLQMLEIGCDGTVSGVSNVYPEIFVQIYNAFKKNDIQTARRLQQSAIKIIQKLHAGTNLAYFKAALSLRGLPGGHMRKPQLDLTEDELTQLKIELNTLN